MNASRDTGADGESRADEENRQLTVWLHRARLRYPEARREDLDRRPDRALLRALLEQLASSQWVREQLNVLITGSTSVITARNPTGPTSVRRER